MSVDGYQIVICDSVVDRDVVAAELPPSWRPAVSVHEGIPEGAGVVAVLVGPDHPLDAPAMERLPTLRAVVVTSMGSDHVDLRAAQARGIAVVGVGDYCVEEVAEHTIALVLDLLRGVTRLDAMVRAGGWGDAGIGRPVRTASLGLIGMGRIGSAVAWRARALGMRVAAYDPRTLPGAGEGERAHDGVRLAASLPTLVSSSDVVSVHVPLTESTRSLVDDALFAEFREGAYLVNVSRGGVVDEAALCRALEGGRLAGAALDVLVHEPPHRDDPVLHAPRTVVTPHAAWYSSEAVRMLSASAGKELRGVLGSLEDASRRPSVSARGEQDVRSEP